MPEYLAPAVYVEETSFRSKSIAGVGTSTAAFVGLAARGPLGTGAGAPTPPLLTSISDYERYYGGPDPLRVNNAPAINHLALAVRAFFDNGGSRLYVARVAGAGAAAPTTGTTLGGNANVQMVGRFPGGASIPGRPGVNLSVTLRQDELETTKASALSKAPGAMVRLGDEYFIMGTTPIDTTAANLNAWNALADDGVVRLVTLAVEVSDPNGVAFEAAGLGLHPLHPRYAGLRLGATPPNGDEALANPVQLNIAAAVTGFQLRAALLQADGSGRTDVPLTGGSDGNAVPATPVYQEALGNLLALEDVSIVAAPGSSVGSNAAAVNLALIAHAETRRSYRIAVLDTPAEQSVAQARALKSGIDSTYAALYYPWITVANPAAATDPTAPQRVNVPPSGAVCGIYARSDIQRGVWKAPANETVTGALDLQRHVRFGEQEVLNPLGVNCIRALPNRGIRVWGARTISSDPEWVYVNIRRYFIYLGASIDRGTQWAVFEPNGERLWDNVRTTVSDFLYNEWISGALLGTSPQEAFFVRCGRETMTQNDIDNGRLICLVGVAALKPAEFVIFRIGQKTVEAQG